MADLQAPALHAPATAGADPAPPAPLLSPAARRYALFLLFCAYTINYVDRQVITILQDPIKAELGLSDTQLGLMTGLSFALFYAVLGVPIARLADIRPRKTIITLSMALWSGMTALCAAAGSFATLLLCRIGVGVGEAGLTPPAHSLISDYYEPERRAAALSIYSSAGTVGMMAGLLAGGWINQYFGWRAAIVIVGLPGILLALVTWATLKEPRRGQYDVPVPATPAAAPRAGPGSGLALLARNPAFLLLMLGCGLHTFVNYGMGNWMAPFLGRVHGMSSGEIGTWLAVLAIGPALLGMVGAGYAADWLSRRRPHARLEIAAASMILGAPFQVGALLATDAHAALAILSGSFFFGGAYLGPSIAAAHALVPPSLRASASAMIMLGVNLIGLGLGPLAVGLLSDAWAGAGSGALRHAMLAIVPGELFGFALLLAAIGRERRARAEAHLV
ncbi:MAG: MFS transporter [Sphingobium sp.]